MANRWTIKDLVLLLLLAFVGLSVWLKMMQDDRLWRKVGAIEARVGDLERRLGQLSTGSPEPSGPAGPKTPASRPGDAPALADDAWARAGTPIERQPPFRPRHDPRADPLFREGGELVELLDTRPKTLTPFRVNDTVSRRIIDLVCQRLADYDPETLELRGVLAEAWQADPGGLWLRVRLRAGARFSDGAPVTAGDVVFTVKDLVMNPELGAPDGKLLRDRLASCTPGDDGPGGRTVEFTFTRPSAFNLPTALRMYVLPKGYYEAQGARLKTASDALAGSGPFKLREADPAGQWVTLARNESYWGPRPPLDGVRFEAAGDLAGRLELFRKGRGDLMSVRSRQELGGLASDPAFTASASVLEWMVSRSSYQFIVWSAGEGSIFADVRVRQAMTMLLDREFIRREFWGGAGVVAKGPFSPAGRITDPGLQPLPFDPSAALALLAQAGWAPGPDGYLAGPGGRAFEFELAHAGDESEKRMSRYIADQFAGAGMRCSARFLAPDALAQAVRERKFDAALLGLQGYGVDPDTRNLWHSASIASGGGNYGRWRCEEADALIDQAEAELDRGRRDALLRRLEAVIAREQPYTFLRAMPWVRVVRERVRNLHPTRDGLSLEEAFLLDRADK